MHVLSSTHHVTYRQGESAHIHQFLFSPCICTIIGHILDVIQHSPNPNLVLHVVMSTYTKLFAWLYVNYKTPDSVLINS